MFSDPHSAANYLAWQLERLLALPLDTKSDLEHWNSERNKVEQALEDQFPSFDPSDDFWHFMADADIRARDSGYRDYRHRLIADYVTRLRNQAGNA
jgi:hypothetical protein